MDLIVLTDRWHKYIFIKHMYLVISICFIRRRVKAYVCVSDYVCVCVFVCVCVCVCMRVRYSADLGRRPCGCAGSWWPVSWWRLCPSGSWRCVGGAADGPARRTPLSPYFDDNVPRHETSPSAVPNCSLTGREVRSGGEVKGQMIYRLQVECSTQFPFQFQSIQKANQIPIPNVPHWKWMDLNFNFSVLPELTGI
jgi:hypothetical protein